MMWSGPRARKANVLALPSTPNHSMILPKSYYESVALPAELGWHEQEIQGRRLIVRGFYQRDPFGDKPSAMPVVVADPRSVLRAA